MKILSAALCASALAFAAPAIAATTDSAKPAKHHHMMKHGKHMKGMKSGKAMDASTDDLNAKSLAAAKGGAPMAGDTGTSTPTPAPMAPATAAPGGTPATTTPSNAPGGQ